jgi:hypothetical protein
MRRMWIWAAGAGLLAVGLGCSKTCQHTAGVCDCCPPPVESVLTPYANVSLPGPPTAPPPAVAPIAPVPTAAPPAVHPILTPPPPSSER